MTFLYDGRISKVPSGDGGEGGEIPPTFKVPRKLRKNGAKEADFAEVGRCLEYNKLFPPDRYICWFARTFLAL